MNANKYTAKDYVSQALLYFVELFAGCWITLFISLLGIFIGRFWLPLGSIEETIFCMIIMTIVMCISLYICAYRRGESRRESDIKMLLIPLPIAFVIQLIYAKILSFSLYTAGPAYYTGNLIYMLSGGTDKGVPDVFVFWCMLAFDIVYVGIYILGEHIGSKRRSKDREQLLSKTNK